MSDQHKNLVVLALSPWLLVITVAFGFATYQTFQASSPEPAILEEAKASDKLPLHNDNLATVVAFAHHYEGEPQHTREITMGFNDRTRFLDHLENIATGRGWYVHNRYTNGHYNAEIVMSEPDLLAIDDIARDPILWIQAEVESGRQPQGPTDADHLVNVELTVEATDATGLGQTIVVAVLAMFTLVGIAVTIVLPISALIDLRG